MDIIIVSSRLSKARTFTISRGQLAGVALLGGVVLLAIAMLFNTLLLHHAVRTDNPMLRAYLEAAQAQQNLKAHSYLRDSLNAMSARLGEMQARLMQLNSLGERVSKLAGVKPQDMELDRPGGRGGALVTSAPQELSLDELRGRIEQLAREVNAGADMFGMLEDVLTEAHARKQLLPTALPHAGGAMSSNYGWRIDPFTGGQAFHEGVDFMAEPGTPILAAAGGVIVASEEHPQYGSMVEVDHGNGLITRYGHASRRLVRLGDVVVRGAKIAEVGSTGRSTGPHLHFEVRINGAAQNPARFFQPPS